MDGLYWLILFAILLVIEIFTMGLTTIWFAVGSLAAFALDWLGFGMTVQLVVFVVLSVLLFGLTRPIAMKYFNKDRTKTNVDSMIGKKALVLEPIDNLRATGKVEVDGNEWTARALEDDKVFAKDAEVSVVRVQGVKLIVE